MSIRLYSKPRLEYNLINGVRGLKSSRTAAYVEIMGEASYLAALRKRRMTLPAKYRNLIEEVNQMRGGAEQNTDRSTK